jgi:hypothetical protein
MLPPPMKVMFMIYPKNNNRLTAEAQRRGERHGFYPHCFSRRLCASAVNV